MAQEAQLSVTQVSRALNDHDDVADATKGRARRAAKKLGYTPNLEARRLKAPDSSSHSIGLVLSNETLRFSDPFFGDLLSGLVTEAGGKGYELQLSTPVDDDDPLRGYDLAIRRKRVDGFVLLRTEIDDPRIGFLLDADFPFVSFGRPEGASGFPSVEPALDCMQPAVDHLVDLGHRRIACLSEPLQFNIGATRLRSFRQSIAVHGADVESTVAEAGFHEGSGYEAALNMLEQPNRPTAIVALNDLLALGALQAADQLGIAVPEQLSVVGFDDIAAARMVRPALTTLHQSAADVGAALIQGLMGSIEEQSPSNGVRTEIASGLVIRSTTAVA